MDIRRKFEMIENIAVDVHKKLFASIFQDIGSSFCKSHIYLLMYIRCKGSCTVTDIANHLGITLSAVTSLVDKLCILGLVIRIRSEMDRRVVFMKLTEEGVRVLEEVDEKRNEIFEKAFSNLSIEEINNFFSVIDKVTENILNSKVEKPNKLYNMGD